MTRTRRGDMAHGRMATGHGETGAGDRSRVLFVHPGHTYNRLGGARLRWDALAAAMEHWGAVTRFEVDCGHGCDNHPTGPEVTDPRGWSPNADPYWYYYCPRTAQRLARLAAEGDWALVVASGLEMTRYLSEIPRTVQCPQVLDIKDVESRLRLAMARATRDRPRYAQYASEETSRQLAGLETAATRHCDAIWTCTEDDKRRLTELYPITASRISVLPNAVVDPGPMEPATPERVVFIGKLSYFPCIQARRVHHLRTRASPPHGPTPSARPSRRSRSPGHPRRQGPSRRSGRGRHT
jgi:hypothetical protein